MYETCQRKLISKTEKQIKNCPDNSICFQCLIMKTSNSFINHCCNYMILRPLAMGSSSNVVPAKDTRGQHTETTSASYKTKTKPPNQQTKPTNPKPPKPTKINQPREVLGHYELSLELFACPQNQVVQFTLENKSTGHQQWKWRDPVLTLLPYSANAVAWARPFIAVIILSLPPDTIQ